MKQITITTKRKVAFYDLDPMNIVWHGNYLKYIEEARCDFFSKLGYDYMDMYADGVMYPVAKMDMKFIKSAKFGDDLVIKTTLKELEPAMVFKYEIFTGENKVFVANSMQICVNTKSGESLYEAPEKLLKSIEDYNA